MLFFQGSSRKPGCLVRRDDSFPGQKWINDALEGLSYRKNNDEGGAAGCLRGRRSTSALGARHA